MTILSIYSPGGPCDRCVATIYERRLSLIHSTLAGVKIEASVNPYHSYNGGGCVNPYLYWAGEGLQTLTHSIFAVHKKPLKIGSVRTPKNGLYAFHFAGSGYAKISASESIIFMNETINDPVEGNEKCTYRNEIIRSNAFRKVSIKKPRHRFFKIYLLENRYLHLPIQQSSFIKTADYGSKQSNISDDRRETRRGFHARVDR